MKFSHSIDEYMDGLKVKHDFSLSIGRFTMSVGYGYSNLFVHFHIWPSRIQRAIQRATRVADASDIREYLRRVS